MYTVDRARKPQHKLLTLATVYLPIRAMTYAARASCAMRQLVAPA